jgi:hypothetical protein
MSSGALPQLVLPESGKSVLMSERNLERSCRKQIQPLARTASGATGGGGAVRVNILAFSTRERDHDS